MIHNVTHFPIMRLDCDDLKRGLVSRANGYAEYLLKRIADEHRQENEKIVEMFEEIRKGALREPSDTKEVMELMKFVEVAQNDTIVKLNKNIKVFDYNIECMEPWPSGFGTRFRIY